MDLLVLHHDVVRHHLPARRLQHEHDLLNHPLPSLVQLLHRRSFLNMILRRFRRHQPLHLRSQACHGRETSWGEGDGSNSKPKSLLE